MKHRVFRFISVVVLLVLGASASAEQRSVRVTLSFLPARTLPGLSVPLSLTIKNSGAPIHLAPGIRLRFTGPGEAPFFAKWREGEVGFLELGTEELYDPLVIGTNETVEVGLSAVSLLDQSWASDPRLHDKPWTWRVEAFLYDMRDKGPTPLAISSPATLSIDPPSGDDAVAWEAIRAGFSEADLKKTLEQPRSRYYPYVVSYAPTGDDGLQKIAVLRRAIELHPDTPVLPRLRAYIAELYASHARQIFSRERDVEKALTYSEKAREELQLLQRRPDAWSKLTARKRLENLEGREYYEWMQKMMRDKGAPKTQ